MFKTLATAWKLPDLRRRMLFTVMILVLFRLGCVIQVPFIDTASLQSVFNSQESTGSLLNYFNLLSGQAFSQGTLFALSVSPYITASIVMQLLGIAIPALERLQKSGEEGQKKINAITRYVTLALALITSYGYYVTLKNSTSSITRDGLFPMFVIIACHCAGAVIIMWMGEKITEHGIGNGISMILFVNIVSSLPTMATAFVNHLQSQELYKTYGMQDQFWIAIGIYVAMLFVAVGIIAFVVFFTESERRLPVQYAKRVVGRKMYGGQSTNLPLKMNMTGVMPIIFASTIVSLPATIAMFFPNVEGFWKGFFNFFSTDSWFYPVFMCVLIVAFAYFYQSISLNPEEVANNLKKNGGFIPGIRPGKPTSDFIKKSLNKITLIGAFFLGVVALIPMLVGLLGVSFGTVTFGGTSLLILVGVIVEVRTQLESQITMRHFKGFLE